MTSTPEISPDFPFKSNYIGIHGSKLHTYTKGRAIRSYFCTANPHLIGEEIAAWYSSL